MHYPGTKNGRILSFASTPNKWPKCKSAAITTNKFYRKAAKGSKYYAQLLVSATRFIKVSLRNSASVYLVLSHLRILPFYHNT